MSNHEWTNAATWDATIRAHTNIEPTDGTDEWKIVTGSRTRGSRTNAQPVPHSGSRKGVPATSRNTPILYSRKKQPANRGQSRAPAGRQTSRQQRVQSGIIEQDLILLDDPVATAETEWRLRKAPVARINLPIDIALRDKKYEELAREQGTFIHTLTDGRPENRHVEFGIWGDPSKAAAARQRILHLINASTRPSRDPRRVESRAPSFSKIASLTPELRVESETNWRRDVQKEKFRQHPPLDMAHDSIGHFHWPNDGDLRPDEVMGKTYEALDPIRMECKCYIVWIDDTSTFRVMGDLEQVKRALHRIRMAYFQIAAQSVIPVHLHVLRVQEGARLSLRVKREPYRGQTCLVSNGDMPPPYLVAPQARGRYCSEEKLQTVRKQAGIHELQIKHIMTGLKQLHYYRGQIKLRFRLGRLMLEQAWLPKSKNSYSLDEYLTMTKESQFKARVTDEIGDWMLESKLLEVMLRANHLLMPPGSLHNSLSEVRPTYHARFTFQDKAGDLCLCMSWSEHFDNQRKTSSVSSGSPTWTRLPVGASRPSTLMNMSLLDLESGLAWAIELTGSRAVDEKRLPPKLANFPNEVSIDAQIMSSAREPDQRFLRYPVTSGLKHVRQMITYEFDITRTEYTLDVTKFNDTVYDASQPPQTPTLSKDAWSLSLDCVAWKTNFAMNESLPIGERADWDDDFSKWFAKDMGTADDDDDDDEEEEPDGFLQLLAKLNEIEALVRDGNVE